MILKLHSGSATDGSAFIDLPASGTLVGLHFTGFLASGAGGVGICNCEVSRAPVNQKTTNNPKGVISACQIVTPAASTSAVVNADCLGQNEKMQVGERLYLNCAAEAANVASLSVDAYLIIS